MLRLFFTRQKLDTMSLAAIIIKINNYNLAVVKNMQYDTICTSSQICFFLSGEC